MRFCVKSNTPSFFGVAVLLASALCAAQVCWCYDGAAAKDYADRHCRNYNPDYPDRDRDGGDCTNFATQCINRGGYPPRNPYYPSDKGGIYEEPGKLPTYVNANILYDCFLSRIARERIGDTQCLKPGDIVLEYSQGEGKFKHAMIVNEVTGGNVIVYQHSDNHCARQLENPNATKWHYFHILPEYVFWTDWPDNCQGAGYYYWLINQWVGPFRDEMVSAAGYSSTEYVGFNQFTVSGMPLNSTVLKAHLRLMINEKNGTGSVDLNINHITDEGDPGGEACEKGPYYIYAYEVTGSQNDIRWIDLSQTGARSDISEVNDGAYNNMFGLGYSGNDPSTGTQYFFDGQRSNPDTDAKLKVFIDDCTCPDVLASTSILDNQLAARAAVLGPSLSVPGLFVGREIEILFECGRPGQATLKVYDSTGRLVRVLADGQAAEGSQKALWDLTDQQGNVCPQGVYFARLESAGQSLVKKTVALR